ncbi:MAG: hypothetical protein ABIM32_06080 [candidate division WOR-3 bacterium]
MYYIKLFVSLLLIFAFSCKKPVMVNLREALENIADVLYPADSNNANVQLAKIPDPDGIPILVGIDKSGRQNLFWVADPTDPTPFPKWPWQFLIFS